MKTIAYKTYKNGQLYETTSKKGYTVREAMEHLKRQGFEPFCTTPRKLPRVWWNGTHMAYILEKN